MNIFEAFALVDAVEESFAAVRHYDPKKKVREFLEALHERGLTIAGTPKQPEYEMREVALAPPYDVEKSQ
ncbi:MAG: hypothetical protein P4L10_11085 [Acidobacteriaceae bacterium]|nr:hypothetical protein [Acidobacteriaceae bacterium]